MALKQPNPHLSNRWTSFRPAQLSYSGLALSSALFFGLWRTRPLYFVDTPLTNASQSQDDLTFQWEVDLSALALGHARLKKALLVFFFFILGLSFFFRFFFSVLVTAGFYGGGVLLKVILFFFAVFF
jgi:hypothetical protein